MFRLFGLRGEKVENVSGNSRKAQTGMSMAELLIVVCVLGILACISIPIFLNQKDKTTIAVTKANLEVMRSGLNQYAARNNSNLYPTGGMNYFDFRTTVPETNLPPLESGAKIVSGSFLYTSDGITYSLRATSTNRTSARFVATPRGIVKQ
jgi:type IV pilus assembly protein PilA